MEKRLSIHDAWDTIEDDQRRFDRTVAELKDGALNIATDKKPRRSPGDLVISEQTRPVSGKGPDQS